MKAPTIKRGPPCPDCGGGGKETSRGGRVHECGTCDGWGFIRKKSRGQAKHEAHKKLWRMVEGAVADAFNSHPDYLTERGRARATESITKRVVGTLVGNANEVRKHSRDVGS